MRTQERELDLLLRQMAAGVPLPSTAEMRELTRQAVKARKNDDRTNQQIIEDGIAFIMDTSKGGC